MDKEIVSLTHEVYGEIRVFQNDLIASVIADGSTVWERSMYDFMMTLYEPGTDILDIGANIGLSCKYMHRARPIDGTFHLFEPQADVFCMLYHNTREVPRKLYNVTLGAPGSRALTFRRSEAPQNIGGTSIKRYDTHEKDDVTVSTIALDDLTFDRRVSLVKMDVEGAEYDVILGGIGLFRRDRPVLEVELLTADAFLRVSHLLASIEYRVTHRVGENDYIFQYAAAQGAS